MTDKQIIHAILNNDKNAFSKLIGKYKNLVYNTAYRLVKNPAETEDIFQDVFLEIYKSCSFIKNEKDLTCWIYKIAYNKSISALRKKNSTNQNLKSKQLEIQNQNSAENNSPEKLFVEKESVAQLYRYIDQLPENQKKVLLLNKFEGYSHHEISEKLNISIHSIESLIYRAKKTLKQKLVNYYKCNT